MMIPFRGVTRCCMLAVGMAVAGAIPLAGADAPPSVDSVHQLVTEWAKIRSENVSLQSNWESERELENSTLKALQERVGALENRKSALVAGSAAERATLADLSARNTASKTALNTAGQNLGLTAEKLVALRVSLPPRLSLALELPYRSLANPALGPGERMQYVTTILNRCLQFNRTITYGEELVTVPEVKDGRVLEVLYWGLSHGYALDRIGRTAYLGSPGPKGWAWEPRPEMAGAVAHLIAIYQDKEEPRFIEVPARVTAALAK